MMKIQLKTLTPLWTGGVDQSCDRLHETGLIGSLRWWYEVLVRGLGGYACDPTQPSCTFDEEKYRKSKASTQRERLRDAGVCDACQLFGCTGWGRKIRIVVEEGERLFAGQNVIIPSGRVHSSSKGDRAGGWFLQSESRVGEIALNLIPIRPLETHETALLNAILKLIGEWGSLGAKASSGYGAVAVLPPIEVAWDALEAFSSVGQSQPSDLPDLRHFFFARFEFSPPPGDLEWWQQIKGIQQAVRGKLDDDTSPRPLREARSELEAIYAKGVLPIAPAIRDWLRYTWQHGLSSCDEHYVFGEANSVCPYCCRKGFREDRQNIEQYWCPNCRKSFPKGKEIPTTASKICVSYAYRVDHAWQFRIWGWLPCNGRLQNRDQFLQSLRDQLESDQLWQGVFGVQSLRPRLTNWQSLLCNQPDGLSYLKTLLGGAQ